MSSCYGCLCANRNHSSNFGYCKVLTEELLGQKSKNRKNYSKKTSHCFIERSNSIIVGTGAEDIIEKRFSETSRLRCCCLNFSSYCQHWCPKGIKKVVPLVSFCSDVRFLGIWSEYHGCCDTCRHNAKWKDILSCWFWVS